MRQVVAAVPEDDGKPGTGLMDRIGGPRQTVDHLVGPQPRVGIGLDGVGMHRGGAAGHQGSTATGTLRQISLVTFAHDAVGILQQHAVSGDDDPIGQGHGTKLDGLKKMGIGRTAHIRSLTSQSAR